jgi:hypothetical protein
MCSKFVPIVHHKYPESKPICESTQPMMGGQRSVGVYLMKGHGRPLFRICVGSTESSGRYDISIQISAPNNDQKNPCRTL